MIRLTLPIRGEKTSLSEAPWGLRQINLRLLPHRHRLQRPTPFQSLLWSAKRTPVISPRLAGVTRPSS
jgi:hypothetical protein